MNETDATRGILKNWQRQFKYFWWIKVPDYFRPGHNYSNERAVDTILCVAGRLIGIEWKLHRSGAFATDRVRPGQINTLRAINTACGDGFLAIIHYRSPQDKILYFIPVEVWVERTQNMKRVNLADVFSEYEIMQIKVGNRINWDMDRWFPSLNDIHSNR